eukprot:gene4534-5650_t
MDAIVTKMEETLERKKSIVYIVEKRTMAIDYIRRIHEAAYYGVTTPPPPTTSSINCINNNNNNGLNGNNNSNSNSSNQNNNQNNNNHKNKDKSTNIHWMNVASIQRSDLEKSVEIQKRLLGWFSLGLSLAPLLTSDKGPAYIRSLVQLMEEYDYHFEMGSAMQGVKVLLSKKQPNHTIVNENEHIKSKIVKIGNTVVYEFLKIFNVSVAKDLDYFHVVFSLLEILEQIYKKIDKETCSSKYVYEALLKIDSRLKHHIFGFLSKEIDKIALQIIREQLEFTILCTSIKDRDIQQHLSIQSKMANSLSSSSTSNFNNTASSSSGANDKSVNGGGSHSSSDD